MTRQCVKFLLAMLPLAGAILAIVLIGWAARTALLEDQVTVHGRWTTEWVKDYVEQHEGRWPASWEDLSDTPSQLANADSLRRVIHIDFDADPKQLAAQSVEEFTAIRPVVDRGYDHRDYWRIVELINALRKFHGGEPLAE